jgi:hypothetical protein
LTVVTKEEGRRKKEEGRRKKEELLTILNLQSTIQNPKSKII